MSWGCAGHGPSLTKQSPSPPALRAGGQLQPSPEECGVGPCAASGSRWKLTLRFPLTCSEVTVRSRDVGTPVPRILHTGRCGLRRPSGRTHGSPSLHPADTGGPATMVP